jgi:hypothetical protein
MINEYDDLHHLNDLYAASEDPWHMRGGWYTERKRDLIMASLPNARYGATFEPGCADGELSVHLARRSDRLLAADRRREAVTVTRDRTAHLSGVSVERLDLPVEWPLTETFDLIVLHELGALFTPSEWADTATAVLHSLTADATVLACHWRHDFAERSLEADTLHGLLDSILGLPRQTRVSDADFTIAVWTTRSRTVAERDGLAANAG